MLMQDRNEELQLQLQQSGEDVTPPCVAHDNCLVSTLVLFNYLIYRLFKQVFVASSWHLGSAMHSAAAAFLLLSDHEPSNVAFFFVSVGRYVSLLDFFFTSPFLLVIFGPHFDFFCN